MICVKKGQMSLLFFQFSIATLQNKSQQPHYTSINNNNNHMENEKEQKVVPTKPQNRGKIKRTIIECEDDSSQWSLDSLEDMKGINIHQLEEEQNNHESKAIQKELLEVKFPEKPNVLSNAPLHEIGKVIFIVGQLWILQASSTTFIVDLDNWVADQNRNLLGFVMDVLGKVQSPFYAIKPENALLANSFLGKSLFYIEGSSKILKDDDIKSMQSKSAMQAVEGDLSSSDDEQIQKERDFSAEKQKSKQIPPWKRQNKFRQDQDVRRTSRERTRQHRPFNNRDQSRSRNEHNQRYLQTMYRRHYNEMLQIQHGFIPPQTHNPFINQPQLNTQQFSHSNIAQFGSNNQPQQFYGQVYQPNLFQGQPGLFTPQQFPTTQQYASTQTNQQQNPPNPFNQNVFQGPKFN